MYSIFICNIVINITVNLLCWLLDDNILFMVVHLLVTTIILHFRHFSCILQLCTIIFSEYIILLSLMTLAYFIILWFCFAQNTNSCAIFMFLIMSWWLFNVYNCVKFYLLVRAVNYELKFYWIKIYTFTTIDLFVISLSFSLCTNKANFAIDVTWKSQSCF